MAEDEIIKKHTKAAYKALKDPEKDWIHKLKEILLEVVIIVFAVSVSIWFHNWSESLKDRHEEKEFLSGLKEDIKADLGEMKSDKAGMQKELFAVRYFQKVSNGTPLDKDSLNKNAWFFFAETQISPRIGRFEALKGSGKLDIITDKKLLYDIIDLYEKDFPQIFRANEGFNALKVNQVNPFISDYVFADEKGLDNWQVALRKSKMRFLLLECEGVTNNIAAYSVAIEKSNEIIKQIDQELK